MKISGAPAILPDPSRVETPAERELKQKFREVSTLYEKQFLREMVKAMRSTIHEGGFLPTNNAEKIFREQLDQQYVESWGDKGGIGLSDLIYQQLAERFSPRPLAGPSIEKTAYYQEKKK